MTSYSSFTVSFDIFTNRIIENICSFNIIDTRMNRIYCFKNNRQPNLRNYFEFWQFWHSNIKLLLFRHLMIEIIWNFDTGMQSFRNSQFFDIWMIGYSSALYTRVENVLFKNFRHSNNRKYLQFWHFDTRMKENMLFDTFNISKIFLTLE